MEYGGIIGVIAIVLWCLPAFIAYRKNRSWLLWLALGLFLPLISLIVVVFLRSLKTQSALDAHSDPVASTTLNDTHTNTNTNSYFTPITETYMTTYDSSDKLNLKTLEGSVELFVDKLEDIGVFDLGLGDEVSFGTYTNNFKCISKESSETEDAVESIDIVECRFYEMQEVIYLKIVNILDVDEHELIDREVYWFDHDLNDDPSHNKNWSELLENMDIFEDDD